jgi:hypothetical protein
LLGYEKSESGPGSTGAGVMGDRLAALLWWCEQNDLPLLTSIFVNEDGLPGQGFYQHLRSQDVPGAQQQVLRYDWYAIEPPTVDELREATEKSRAP